MSTSMKKIKENNNVEKFRVREGAGIRLGDLEKIFKVSFEFDAQIMGGK